MSEKKKNLERELEIFNSHLRKNGYETVNWSDQESILDPLLTKLVTVSNEMEDELQIRNNPNKLRELESDSEIIMCGLNILKSVMDISSDK